MTIPRKSNGGATGDDGPGAGAGGRGSGSIAMFEVKKYKADDFLIPAADTKGHSERIYFRIQPGLMRDLNSIKASGKFPFRTIGDIGRLGVKLLVDQLLKMEKIPSVAGQVDAIMKIVRDEEFHQEFINTFEEIGKAVNRYISGGEERRARKVVAEIRGQIQSMPDGYWRTKYLKKLEQTYGALLKPGTELVEEANDDEDEE